MFLRSGVRVERGEGQYSSPNPSEPIRTPKKYFFQPHPVNSENKRSISAAAIARQPTLEPNSPEAE